MMMPHKCAVCGKEEAKLRCSKCQSMHYCGKDCQRQDWRCHKKWCTSDESVRRYVTIETAVERALGRFGPIEDASAARCYICLDDEGSSSSSKKDVLLRGCACRGDAAGFVHVRCLLELAIRKESKPRERIDGYTTCVNCRQLFTGRLQMEITREWWRRHRDATPDIEWLRMGDVAGRCLGNALDCSGEEDAASLLFQHARTIGRRQQRQKKGALASSSRKANDEDDDDRGDDRGDDQDDEIGVANRLFEDLGETLRKARRLSHEKKKVAALELLEKTLKKLASSTSTSKTLTKSLRTYYFDVSLEVLNVLLELQRFEECLMKAEACLAVAKEQFPEADGRTHQAMKFYAFACAFLGRYEETAEVAARVLKAERRIYGRDHPITKRTVGAFASLRSQLALEAGARVDENQITEAAAILDFLLLKKRTDNDDEQDEQDGDVRHQNFDTKVQVLFTCNRLGRYDDAVSLGVECADVARRTYGMDSPRTHQTLRSYAVALANLGQVDASLRLHREVLLAQTRVYGPDHPDTKQTRWFLQHTK